MGKKIIIGNWKMHLNMHEASLYLHKLLDMVSSHRDVETVVAPTMLTLQGLSLQTNRRVIKLAAQNCYWRDYGTYTGEVPAAHLRGIADYVIIGHSERRHVFLEKERDIRFKVQAALRNHLQPILCIGETLQERSMGETQDVLHDQLVSGLANVTAEEFDKIIVAYEPVWAIGTGESANTKDVEDAMRVIRRHISQLFGKKASLAVRIIYGGSVNSQKADDYLKIDQLDGLLIGDASLNAHQFAEIVEKAHKTKTKREGK